MMVIKIEQVPPPAPDGAAVRGETGHKPHVGDEDKSML